MSLNQSDDLTARYVKRALESQGDARLRVAKESMFQPPEEVVSKYQKIFRERGLEVLIHCVDDDENPRIFFKLYIRRRNNDD